MEGYQTVTKRRLSQYLYPWQLEMQLPNLKALEEIEFL